jgi:hypothetical protein
MDPELKCTAQLSTYVAQAFALCTEMPVPLSSPPPDRQHGDRARPVPASCEECADTGVMCIHCGS